MTATAEERRQLRDRFRDVLLTAAEERDKRRGIVETPHGPVCEWMLYEEQQLLIAVNRERSRRRMPLASADQVANANAQAGGHVDYADKVALYCAEIAMGFERTVY